MTKTVHMKRMNRVFPAIILTLLVLANVSNAGTLINVDESDSLSREYEIMNQAEITIPEDADLQYYLRLAMKRSPRLRSSFYRWQASIEKSGYAGAFPDPMISFTHFVENVETRVGPQEERIGFRQAIPWFGTLGAKKDMAIEEANAAYRKLEAVRLQITYEVKAAYYDLYFLGQDLQITRDNMELLRFWESVAQSKYKVGLKQHPDVIKAQVELGKLEDQLKSLEEMTEPAAARLRALLNLPETTAVPVPKAAAVLEMEPTRESVIAAILDNNPDLQAIDHMIERADAGVRLAGKLSRPSFSLGVDYIFTGEAINPSLDDSGKDPWMVGVGLSLPIWFGKNRSRNAEAIARQREAEYDYNEKRNRLTAVADQVIFDYSDALRKARLYRDGLVPKAEQSLNASYASYQAGDTDFLNVLDAQRQLLDFQLNAERERVRLAKTAAKIEMLTGYELEQLTQ
jgi:cobalt-zinc-cadmium efflux system outer membrane protein